MKPGSSFIQQPVRSLQSMLRLLSRNYPSIPNVIPDGIYGKGTMRAVSAFQTLDKIPVTGIADELTWNRIAVAYDKACTQQHSAEPIEIILNPGPKMPHDQKAADIYILQAMLASLSLSCPDIPKPELTGTIDGITSQALSAFQKLSGIPQTSEPDRATWEALCLQYTLHASHHKTQKDATGFYE